MADKLDWLNQHPLWFIYPTVNEVVTLNQLELSTPLKALAARFPIAEDYLKALWYDGKFKDACTFCAYNTNPRVAVWWAYSCVIDLIQELTLKPAENLKIEDIAKPRPFNIPDWCKFPELDPSVDAEMQKQYAELAEVNNKLLSEQDKLISMMPPKFMNFYNSVIENTFTSIKNRCGYDPRELLKECIDKLSEVKNIPEIDPNSPIFQAADELHQKIETMRTETVDLIKSVIPEADPEKQAQISANCLDGVWAYLISPNENNAQRVFQLGNANPNMIECLLASVAFWSYGSLTPNQVQVIKTPPGLMANGINGLLVKCATSVGGLYKPVERFERYFTLAFKAITNQSSWESYVERNTSPHKEMYIKLQQILLQQAAEQQKANAHRMATKLGPDATPGSSAIVTPNDFTGKESLAHPSQTTLTPKFGSNAPNAQSQNAESNHAASALNALSGVTAFKRNQGMAPQHQPQAAAIYQDQTQIQPQSQAQPLANPQAQSVQAVQSAQPSPIASQSQQHQPAQASSVDTQRQAAERELQARLAQVRAEVGRRFRGK